MEFDPQHFVSLPGVAGLLYVLKIAYKEYLDEKKHNRKITQDAIEALKDVSVALDKLAQDIKDDKDS